MAYSILLSLHIVGALATGISAAYACVILWNGISDKFRFYAQVLGLLAGLEIVTGTALSVLSAQISAGTVCERVALYLAVVAIIEALLFARMRGLSITFPMPAVLTPSAAGLALLGAALAMGF